MSASVRIPADEADAIDVISLWGVIWRYRYLIALTTFICGSLAVGYALTATRIYRAEVVIAEAHDTEMGGNGSSLSGQIGGLASLAGLDLSNSNSDHDAQGVLNSRHLIEEFVKRQNLIPLLLPNNNKATLWKAVKRFKDHVVTIREDKRSNLTTVGIDWTDPKTAAEWANGFVSLCNDLVRTRALDESTRNIGYLNQQISQTNVVDLHRIIYNLIESEMKTLMLANGRTEYAFTVIDPAVAPEIRKSPQSVVVLIAGLSLGLCIGIMTAFTRERLAAARRS